MNRVVFDWPIVRLGEVISHRKEFIQIEDTQKYKRCRVQLHAKGVVLRDEVEGSIIKTKKQQVCHSGELLVAEIDAKVGGFGVVPSELDGSIVSSHYFLYTINPEKINGAFIDYFVRTPLFRDQVQAQGSTNYAAIKANQVLDYQIPLPPLAEQCRIVAKIERLDGKIEDVKGLRASSTNKTNFLDRGFSSELLSRFSDNAEKLERLSHRITKGESPRWQGFSYQDIGPLFVRSENVLWGKMDTTKETRIPMEFHEKLLRSQLNPYDVLINLVGASIGRACKIPNGLGPANINQAVAVISPKRELLDPNFLLLVLLGSDTQATLHGGKVDTARPNISLTDLRNLKIPLPPLNEQRRIVEYLDGFQAKMNELKALQAKTTTELNAMLSSILDRAFKGEL